MKRTIFLRLVGLGLCAALFGAACSSSGDGAADESDAATATANASDSTTVESIDLTSPESVTAALIAEIEAAGVTPSEQALSCINAVVAGNTTTVGLLSESAGILGGSLGPEVIACLGADPVSQIFGSLGMALTATESECVVQTMTAADIDLTAATPPAAAVETIVDECLTDATMMAAFNPGLPDALALNAAEARCFFTASVKVQQLSDADLIATTSACGVLGRTTYGSLQLGEAVSFESIACVDTAASETSPDDLAGVGLLFQGCATDEEFERINPFFS